jgi:hypothetical protein
MPVLIIIKKVALRHHFSSIFTLSRDSLAEDLLLAYVLGVAVYLLDVTHIALTVFSTWVDDIVDIGNICRFGLGATATVDYQEDDHKN